MIGLYIWDLSFPQSNNSYKYDHHSGTGKQKEGIAQTMERGPFISTVMILQLNEFVKLTTDDNALL